MLSKYHENKSNIGNDIEKYKEIAYLRELLDKKEKELKTSLETASLKEEILLVREKLEATKAEAGLQAAREHKEAKIEIAKESNKESREQNFEDLSTFRKSIPTKAQIKKITQQMKDADISHQLVVLVNLVRLRGVYYALRIAKKLGNAYLLDRLHDAIVNDLYEELIKNKKLHS